MALAHHGLRGGDRGGIPGRLSEHRRRRGRGNGAAGEHERHRSFGLDVTRISASLPAPMTCENEGERVMSFTMFSGWVLAGLLAGLLTGFAK